MDVTEVWEPLALVEVVSLFGGADFRWWIAGGSALELHCGQSWRTHSDVDVGIVRSDARRARVWLCDWDLRVSVAGELKPLEGADLDPAISHNNIWARRQTDGPWSVDITVGEGDDDTWIYRRDHTIRRPWSEAVLFDDDIPYLAPELQLLFKSKNVRRKDQIDAEQVIPDLPAPRRSFLHHTLPDEHPWQALLE